MDAGEPNTLGRCGQSGEHASGAPFGPVRSSAARQLADFAEGLGEFALVGDQDRQSLLDGEADRAAGADEMLLVAREGGLALGVEGAAEERKEGIVHVRSVARCGKQKTPGGLLHRGLYIFANW